MYLMGKLLGAPHFGQVGTVNPEPLVRAPMLVNLVQSLYFPLFGSLPQNPHVWTFTPALCSLPSTSVILVVCKPSGFGFVSLGRAGKWLGTDLETLRGGGNVGVQGASLRPSYQKPSLVGEL